MNVTVFKVSLTAITFSCLNFELSEPFTIIAEKSYLFKV